MSITRVFSKPWRLTVMLLMSHSKLEWWVPAYTVTVFFLKLKMLPVFGSSISTSSG